MQTLFEIGSLFIDDDALSVIRKNGGSISIDELLDRHQAGDWGNAVEGAYVIENSRTLIRKEGPVISVHRIGGQTITITTTLMPWHQPNLTEIEILE